MLPVLGIWALHAQSVSQSDGISATPSLTPLRRLPSHVLAAHKLFAQRAFNPSGSGLARQLAAQNSQPQFNAAGGTVSSPTWQPVGPAAVSTPDYDLVTGRVTALALDPSDTTGNRLYLGTTGGGVWVAQNAGTSNASSVIFTPLTDTVGALSGALDASIDIGAITVQPGGTGVILAGTGEQNDLLDSYYGAGILRSTDGGNSWSLVSQTSDVVPGLGAHDERFYGEAFAGFAWSTVNTQLVVAAVSQAIEGDIVDAVVPLTSNQGLYYSTDAGATWHESKITDGGSKTVQGPLFAPAAPDGNAATSVVWNPVRKIFIAAIRFHGYYQSPDGVTFTRMAAQPGSNFTTALCPNNPGLTGSIACPIYRGTLAVNPSTGDTYAWTVDIFDQDQGLWEDQCAISGGACTNQNVTFAKRWSTSAFEINTTLGANTIIDGSYTLALAAIPAGLGNGQDTLLFAGADDLWKCSLAAGCVWRNTTNTSTCQSARVGAYQHALAWNAANPAEIFIGNDSGVWRSTDAAGETGQVCSAGDKQHFQNLNAYLGSLADVVSFSTSPTDASHILVGLGTNGTAGVKNSTAASSDWSQVLGGYGGPVAIDPSNSDTWYVNNQSGVAIYRCSTASNCTASSFGSAPVVDNTDLGGDGLSMQTPAPFLVDPLDPSQLLIGTCRLWRGSATGVNWSSKNAVSPILDNHSSNGPCSGDALIRSMAGTALSNGTERVYVGTYGRATFGANLGGHVLTAVIDPASSKMPVWRDLTLSPVSNRNTALNYYGMDVSSIYIDPHDSTGNTVYITIEGVNSITAAVETVYRSVDGGAHWFGMFSNLTSAPASSIVVDPQDANTVYVATDTGVYYTTQVANCSGVALNCWSVYGSGLPLAPVVSLSLAGSSTSSATLLAATYGRGIWQAPLASAAPSLSTATVNPTSLTFAGQAIGTTSSAQTITLQNAGSIALNVTSIQASGDFSETDNCTSTQIAVAATCSIQVKFAPNATGNRTGQIAINANIAGGQITVSLIGTGLAGGVVVLSPSSLDFGQVAIGSTSSVLPAQAENSGASAVAINSITITGPFSLATNSCGTTSLAANTSCQMQIKFAPTQAGTATGTLTMVDAAGTQTVALSGIGLSNATDTLSAMSLSFPATAPGALSDPQTITMTNSGDVTLSAISASATGPFQTSNTCNAQLASHASCSVKVIFAPTQQGHLTGTLSVSDELRTQTLALAGTGIAPAALSVVPMSLSFSAQQTGVTSAPQTITVSNTGAAPMANVGFQFSGAAAANYAVSGTNCGTALNGGASCTAQIVFTPSGTGAIAASLVVSSSTAGVTPVTVNLNGSGQVGTGITATPSQLNFSTVGVGLTSTAQTVTVTNSSGYAVSSLAVVANSPFVLSQNTCTGILAAGANCTALVAFQPSATGAATGALTISSPDLSSPASVTLTGTGFDFAAAYSGSGSLSVASGQTANFTLTINPASGQSGTFTFACGSLPTNTVCIFNPTTMTITAGATGSVNVALATGKSASASLGAFPGERSLTLICGLLLMPLALTRRRKLLLNLLVLALMVMVISSCSGSSGGSSGGGSGGSGGSGSSYSTPPGTYKIPVTITSTGISHVVTLTLTVD